MRIPLLLWSRAFLDAKVDFVTDDVPRDPVVFSYRDRESSQSAKSGFGNAAEEDSSTAPFESELASPANPRSSGVWITRALLALSIVSAYCRVLWLSVPRCFAAESSGSTVVGKSLHDDWMPARSGG